MGPIFLPEVILHPNACRTLTSSKSEEFSSLSLSSYAIILKFTFKTKNITPITIQNLRIYCEKFSVLFIALFLRKADEGWHCNRYKVCCISMAFNSRAICESLQVTSYSSLFPCLFIYLFGKSCFLAYAFCFYWIMFWPAQIPLTNIYCKIFLIIRSNKKMVSRGSLGCNLIK